MEEQQCGSITQSQCNSDVEDESDLEQENQDDKGQQEDDGSSTKSLNSDSTANTENPPADTKVAVQAIEIEQVVDQLKLGSENPAAVATQH